MSDILLKAIDSVQNSNCAFCHYITPNDTGKTGSHQAGFLVPLKAARMIFANDLPKGENQKRWFDVTWQGNRKTQSCLTYYGKGTRNECRITRFGKDFEWQHDDHCGDLLIIAQITPEEMEAWILSEDEDIDDFCDFYSLAPDNINNLIVKNEAYNPDDNLNKLFYDYIANLSQFPETRKMSLVAQHCYNKAYKQTENEIAQKPDDILLHWVSAEYRLFQLMERKIYEPTIVQPFDNLDQFLNLANQILNRRKSRAGKSLEHHLASIFDASHIKYEEQVYTEGKKQPDFIFPNSYCYHNFNFPASNLVSLAAKTTCKDRWRQVISEAGRIPEKHLFTLQQSISHNQLKEMSAEHVHLVVPRKYIHNFPKEDQSSIWDLKTFIQFVRQKQDKLPKTYLFA